MPIMTVRTLTAVAALVAVAGIASPASAQTMADTKPATLMVAGGLALPVGDLSNIANTGFIGLGGVTYRRLGLPLAARAEVLYHRLGADEGSAFPGRPLFTVTNRVATLGLATSLVLTVSDTDRGQFYGIGGLGVYRQNVQGVALGGAGGTTEENTTRGGFNVGAGFERPLGNANWFVEARLHQMFSGNPNGSVIPLTVGVRF